jgi:hypothetical protein
VAVQRRGSCAIQKSLAPQARSELLFRATCTLEAFQSVVCDDFLLAKIVAKRCVCGNQQPIR